MKPLISAGIDAGSSGIKVAVTANRAGDRAEVLATAVQHELDHLDGQLIIDFLSRLKRDMVIRKFKKQVREARS